MAQSIARGIAATTGRPFLPNSPVQAATGARWTSQRFDNARTGTPAAAFVKLGGVECAPAFAAEADGLETLRGATNGFRVPAVLARGTDDPHAWLALEWIDLSPLDDTSGGRAGVALAALHRNTGPAHDGFGWPRDNFIGATPQVNTPDKDWVHFFQHRRLLFQLGLAAKNRYPTRMIDRGERLVADLPALFRDYTPVPSLLHGDLWGGNAARDIEGAPVIFDPAVYRGDREADLAMSELFGGFPRTFYTEYRNAWPLDTGYAVRKHLYNLYHLLNHANLFASDYVRQSGDAIERLLAEL
ncbi:MAG: fructosamine kinase family protein [Betaproteobacteria bacterium]|nr:fructosamine kinase family protein [Betaproteobacteria bacterium]